MLFVIQYRTFTDHRNSGQDRFRQTGGGPPAGVKMIGRWHYADGSGGVTIAETDDPAALGRWAQEWSDVIQMEARPALDDAAMAGVLGG